MIPRRFFELLSHYVTVAFGEPWLHSLRVYASIHPLVAQAFLFKMGAVYLFLQVNKTATTNFCLHLLFRYLRAIISYQQYDISTKFRKEDRI